MTVDDIVKLELSRGVFGTFAQRKYLDKAPDHVKRQLEEARKFPHIYAVRQGFRGMDVSDVNPASFGAVGGGSVAEVNLWTLPAVWSAIPANDMKAGKKYTVCCGGLCSTVTAPTVTWNGRVGQSGTPSSNANLGTSTAVATGSGLAAVPFYAELTMSVRSVGVAAAGATCVGHGFSYLGNVAAAAAQVAVFGGLIPATVDQTIAQGLVISITFGTSNAGNTFTTHWVAMASDN